MKESDIVTWKDNINPADLQMYGILHTASILKLLEKKEFKVTDIADEGTDMESFKCPDTKWYLLTKWFQPLPINATHTD